MSVFKDREKGEETKFARDAELRFKATVKRNRLMGHWVATEFLGKSGEDAEQYAGEVVAADFEKPGDDDVVEFILKSVEAAGADLSEHRIRNKMDEFMREAQEALTKG
jgi:hypothetical protein